MYGFIARQPIFNPEMNTVAYELLVMLPTY